MAVPLPAATRNLKTAPTPLSLSDKSDSSPKGSLQASKRHPAGLRDSYLGMKCPTMPERVHYVLKRIILGLSSPTYKVSDHRPLGFLE